MPSAILPSGILTETIAGVTDILAHDIDRITVERAVFGQAGNGAKAACKVIGPGEGRDPSCRQLAS
jgi:hypothetical protein